MEFIDFPVSEAPVGRGFVPFGPIASRICLAVRSNSASSFGPASPRRRQSRRARGETARSPVRRFFRVGHEDRRPEFGVAGGDARRVQKSAGHQMAILVRQRGGQRRGHDVRNVARLGQRSIVGCRPTSRRRSFQGAAKKCSSRSTSCLGVLLSGVNTQTRFSNRSGLACAQPCFSEPAIGCEPMKRHSRR